MNIDYLKTSIVTVTKLELEKNSYINVVLIVFSFNITFLFSILLLFQRTYYCIVIMSRWILTAKRGAISCCLLQWSLSCCKMFSKLNEDWNRLISIFMTSNWDKIWPHWHLLEALDFLQTNHKIITCLISESPLHINYQISLKNAKLCKFINFHNF